MRIQNALAQQGAFSGPADGLMNKHTLAAICDYQTRLGDPPTGVLTQKEIVRLLNPTGPTP
jgi:peptidoglycan hydrolase-like protein with peptidoglycan-binding domain